MTTARDIAERVAACSCGEASTEQVPVGRVLRGSRWLAAVAWMCELCAAESRREREAARAS